MLNLSYILSTLSIHIAKEYKRKYLYCLQLNKSAGREQSIHLGILEATDLTGICSSGTRGNPEQTGQHSSRLTCLQGPPTIPWLCQPSWLLPLNIRVNFD